jgi:hypothetical protein
MKRHLFFILGFPPAFMNLLLIGAHPDNLLHYFLSGYVVAALPALAISLTDELMERGRTPVRALWCGLIGCVFAPVAIGLGGLGVSGILHTAMCGGLVGFLCAMAYGQTLGRVRAVTPLVVAAAPVAVVAPVAAAFVPLAEFAELKAVADVPAEPVESTEEPALADFDEPEVVAMPPEDVVASADVIAAPAEAPAVQVDDAIIEAEALPAKSEEPACVA